jgi:hypothetical protein
VATKTEILTSLSRNTLLATLDDYDLEAEDRRKKDELVETLSRSRRAKLEDILLGLPRKELKSVCRSLGLDDSGNAKQAIVD